jgi:hypothetical protein
LVLSPLFFIIVIIDNDYFGRHWFTRSEVGLITPGVVYPISAGGVYA